MRVGKSWPHCKGVGGDAERETLIRLLKRLHENLAAVEGATAAHVALRFPKALSRRDTLSNKDTDD